MPWHFLRKKNATKTRSVWSPGYAQIAKWPPRMLQENCQAFRTRQSHLVWMYRHQHLRRTFLKCQRCGGRGWTFMEWISRCFCELILVLGVLHTFCSWFVCVEIWQRSPCLCPFSQYNLCTTDWTIWDIEDSRFCVWSQVTVQCPDHPDPFAGIEVGGGR